MKFIVLLNEKAGTLAGMQADDARQRIVDGFAAAGAQVEVRSIGLRWVEQHAREACETDVDAVIAAGDDQTRNSIVNALVKAGRKPFGFLPNGVDDHLAAELEIPLNLDEAIAALANGSIGELAVIEVNGRMVLNVSTIGLRTPADLRLSARGRTVVRHTPAIVVSNNPRQLRAMGIDAPPSLERGLLNVHVVSSPRHETILGRVLHALLPGHARAAPRFQAMALPDLRVDTERYRKIELSIDGEILRARLPLTYRIRATSLRVLMPAQPSPGTAS